MKKKKLKHHFRRLAAIAKGLSYIIATQDLDHDAAAAGKELRRKLDKLLRATRF